MNEENRRIYISNDNFNLSDIEQGVTEIVFKKVFVSSDITYINRIIKYVIMCLVSFIECNIFEIHYV